MGESPGPPIINACCPKCQSPVELPFSAVQALEAGRARDKELQCALGHSFGLHAGVIEARCNPDHYGVFRSSRGIESGQETMGVGEWRVVRLRTSFEQIDEVQTVCFPAEENVVLRGTKAVAHFDTKLEDRFWLLTSGTNENWGQSLKVNWVVYGAVIGEKTDVWRENLSFAARQLLKGNYRPCVIQSEIAVESFLYHFAEEFLVEQNRWRPSTVREYILGGSRDAVPLQGVLKICVEELMGIRLGEDILAGWRCLKAMRDALAHGDLERYRRSASPDGRPFACERDRAGFAYRSAVMMIYELRYARPI